MANLASKERRFRLIVLSPRRVCVANVRYPAETVLGPFGSLLAKFQGMSYSVCSHTVCASCTILALNPEWPLWLLSIVAEETLAPVAMVHQTCAHRHLQCPRAYGYKLVPTCNS